MLAIRSIAANVQNLAEQTYRRISNLHERMSRLPCYAVMPYSKVMAEENSMPNLYNNHRNLTIEVLDSGIYVFRSV